MATSAMFKAKLPVLLFLGSVFLAMASASVGLAYWEKENPKYGLCVKSCALENDASMYHACHARCRQREEEQEDDPQERGQQHQEREQEQQQRQTQRQREQEEERRREKQRREQERPGRRGREEEEEQTEESRGRHGHHNRRDPEESERQREERQQRQKEQEQERRREEQRREQEEERRRQRQAEQEDERRREKHRREQERPGRGGREEESEEEEMEESQRRLGHHSRRDPEESERQREERQQRQKEQEQGQERRREEQRREQEEEQRREKQRREQERPGRRSRGKEGQGSNEQRQQNQNPYYFPSRRFQTRFENEHGRLRVLERFDQRFNHLRQFRHYRLAEFELKPHCLFLPHHHDAEALLVVLRGRAIFSIVNQNSRESFNVEQGDVLRIPAGAIVYVANSDERQNLRVAKLVLPINIPGQFENFYPSGNQNPQSYYQAFSRQTLEATFNAQYNEIERVLFGEQKGREQSSGEGVMVRLSREQIRELCRHAKSSPRGGKSSRLGPFNLRNLQPQYSNNYGNLSEARPQDFEPLQDLGISVTFLDLNKGSLFLPHYNSKAIYVAQVVDGTGRLEIASPHLANQRSEEEGEEIEQEEQQQQQEEESEGQIQRVSSRLSQADVFLVLAGHPIALRAYESNNLRVVGFGFYVENNQRNFLGGERDNVIKQIESPVKEKAFQGSSQDVERLLRNQRESYFVNAERQQSEETQERRAPLSSILGAFF